MTSSTNAKAAPESAERLTFSSIIAALSFALDLTEGAQEGHAVRSCLLGMRLGEELGLPEHMLADLYYTLLLKDAGCSANASRLHEIVAGDEIRAKAFTKTNDWTRYEWRQFRFLFQSVARGEPAGRRLAAIGRLVKNSSGNAQHLFTLRCTQGSGIAKALGLGEGVAQAVYSLDEHWDGKGYPHRLRGAAIPVLSQIANLAQTLDVFEGQGGPAAAEDCLHRRKGRWFSPELVQAAASLQRRGALWTGLHDPQLRQKIAQMEPAGLKLQANDQTIDNICLAFAKVIDAKSHSTYTHSVDVARIAAGLGRQLGFGTAEQQTLRRAALLHDIGKLGVPNSILDKPGRLTVDEWNCVRRHPFLSEQVLRRIPHFEGIAEIAGSHHERLDGSGYHRGLKGAALGPLTRVLVLADVFEALTAVRSYRTALRPAQALEMMRRDVPQALDVEGFRALEAYVERGGFREPLGSQESDPEACALDMECAACEGAGLQCG